MYRSFFKYKLLINILSDTLNIFISSEKIIVLLIFIIDFSYNFQWMNIQEFKLIFYLPAKLAVIMTFKVDNKIAMHI